MLRSLRFGAIALLLVLFALPSQAQVYLCKQGSGYTVPLPDVVASSDHIAGLTGQTGTVYLARINGAAGTVTKAASTNSIVETDSVNLPGQYTLSLTATETGTLGYVKGYYKAASSDPISFTVKIVAYDPDDSAALGLSRVDVASSSRMASFTLPTNFSSLAINSGSGGVTVFSNLDKTQYALSSSQNFSTSGTVGGLLGVTFPSNFSSFVLDGSGRVTIGGYATGQDPASLLKAMVVDGTFTWAQSNALSLSIAAEGTRTFNSSTHTAVATYYRRLSGGTGPDLTRPIMVKTTVYDSTNAQPVSQSIVFSNLP